MYSNKTYTATFNHVSNVFLSLLFVVVFLFCFKCIYFYCRDAVSDLALHFLAKMKIMVVKDIEREDIEFVTRVNCISDFIQFYNINM